MDFDTSESRGNVIYFSLAFLMLFVPSLASFLRFTLLDFTVYKSSC